MALILGINTVGLLTSVSTSLMVNTLLYTLSNTNKSVQKLLKIDGPTYDNILVELEKIDIDFTVNVISQAIKEISNKIDNDCTDIILYYDKIDSKKMAINYIVKLLEEINDELAIIYSDVKCHNEKYLKEWRTFECDININNIKIKSKILKDRFNILLQLYSII